MEPAEAVEFRERIEQFRRKFRAGLVALVFTDVVGSTRLKETLGDRAGVALIQHHHAMVREVLALFPEAEEVVTAGDSFFLVFLRPSDAVRFALLLQSRNRALSEMSRRPVQDRIGIHIGEVLIERRDEDAMSKDFHGAQVDIAARVMSLAEGDQILLTRGAFDNARQALKGEDLPGVGGLTWLDHGPFLLAGVDEPLEVCEVGETAWACLKPPGDSAKAKRQVPLDAEPALGWRPAVGQAVPNTNWVLEEKLGEGGFGEVWVGRHQNLKERRVFKFCFRADRARSLRREVTLFRVLKERIGEHPNIVRLYEVFFDHPPYYLEMDYLEGKDLRTWCDQAGGMEQVPLGLRLEVVAQVADALQAAHDAGVIHRDVKPSNILIAGSPLGSGRSSLTAKLTDFGVGQVVSEEYLAGVTRAGFTQTMLADRSTSRTGTQLYMAPELLAGQPASPRTDIYSLGVVLYQLVLGDLSRPLTTDWAQQVTDALLREDLKLCFAGNPAERFSRASQLAERLRSLPERRAALEREQAQQAARERAAYRRGVLRTAAIGALVAVSLAVLAAYAFYQARRAAMEAERAKLKEAEARQVLYAADMNLAQTALEVNNVGRARQLLDRHRPEPGGPDLRGWEWRHLWRRCQSDALCTLTKYTNRVFSLSFSADARLLAVGYLDGRVQVWDPGQHRLLATLQTNGQVAAVAFAPLTNILVATAGPGTVALWDPVQQKPVARFQHGFGVRALAFSPTGELLAVHGADGMLSIWNAHSAKEVHRLLVKGLVGAFRGLTIFSPDGQRLAVGETDGSVRLLEVGTWKELLRFPAHQEGITALVFCRKGEFLVSGSGYTDLTLRVWDLAKGAPDATLTGHSAWIGGLALSPDGNTLASAAGDQSVRLWDVADWKEIVVLRGHSDEVAAVAFSPDGRTLASGSRDGSVLLWDASRRQKSTARFTFPAKLTRVEVLEDGTNAVTLDERNRLSRWNVATGEETPLLTLTNKFLAFSPGGQLFLLNRASQTVEAWDLLPPPPRLVFTVPVGEVEENPVFFMSLPLALYSDDRGSLALGGLSNGIQLISLKRPQQPVRLQVQKGRAWPASFADRGRRLATGNGQETLTLWDLERHQPIASLELPGLDRVRRLSWDGRWLARGFRDEIKVYNLDGAAQPPLRLAHGGIISDIAFSPDGSVLASASEEGLVKLWNLPSGSLRVTLRAALTGVHGLAFSPDGRRLATGSGGREAVRIWDLATAQEVATLGAEGSLFRARFSRDGNTIVAEAMAERIWYAWHAPSLAEIAAVEKTPAASPPTR